MSTPPPPPLDAAEDDPDPRDESAPGYSAADRTAAQEQAAPTPGGAVRHEPSVGPPAQDHD